jgi:hypothetical protein
MTKQKTRKIDIGGTWNCQLDSENRGVSEGWQEQIIEQHLVTLPGTTLTNNIGKPWSKKLISGLTPSTDHIGPAWFQRSIHIPPEWCGKYLELFLERCCWQTFVWFNGIALGTSDSLVAPHVYDLSGAVVPGPNQLTIMVDNANIKTDIRPTDNDGAQSEDLTLAADQQKRLNCGGHHTVFGGFAWNGITGRMEILSREHVRITEMQVYPNIDDQMVGIALTYANDLEEDCPVTLDFSTCSNSLKTETEHPSLKVICRPGTSIINHTLKMGNDVLLWDEFSPETYQIRAVLDSAQGIDSCITDFGMRNLSQIGTQLAINGRPTFLRGALENFMHPVTGHPPTDIEYWLNIFTINREHGLNHVRFHSCCPPEAAFSAADQLGIILNVELPGRSGGDVEDPITRDYLDQEAMRILQWFGNHPSFCMLTMGNELLYDSETLDEYQPILMKRVAACKELDNRHWYCCTAHPHTKGRDDDFYVSAWPKGATWEANGKPITGIRWSGFDVVDSSRFNTHAPETTYDYREGIAGIEKPVITHEVGQWAAYPDITEASKFTGVCKAYNLDIIRRFMEEKGTLPLADKFVKASAQLSLLLYKEEIESALRTPGLAGFQLLGFHDHPPQGTSTIGIVTALRESKGIISPEEFRQFCGTTVPLARLPKRTYTSQELFTADVDVVHSGPADIAGAAFCWRLLTDPDELIVEGVFQTIDVATGTLTRLGTITADLSIAQAPAKLRLEVFLERTEIINSWDLWVYPVAPSENNPGVSWSRTWDRDQAKTVQEGATLILELTEEQIPHATRGCFTSLFWNPIMKRAQKSLTHGVLCDPDHPALKGFPTEFHSNWQWWDVLRPSRVLNLDGMQPQPEPIVRMIDSFIGNRCLSVLFEARLGKGRIMVTSLDLTTDLQNRLAARQLKQSLLEYAVSTSFNPKTAVTTDALDRLIAYHVDTLEPETREQIRARLDSD